MIAVTQTKIHNEYTRGNCLQACLASLLELDIAEVPSFEMMDSREWKSTLIKWLFLRGVSLVKSYKAPSTDDYYLAVGDTSRGVLHCVIFKNEIMVHDPHPSQDGLINEKYYWSLVSKPAQALI